MTFPHQDVAQQVGAETTAPERIRSRRSQYFQLALLAVIIAFALLTFVAQQMAYFALDLRITHAVQALRTPLFDGLMGFISWFGFAPQALMILAAIGLLLYSLNLRQESIVAIIAAIGVGLLNAGMKFLVHRPRPPQNLVEVAQLLDSYSFPSGHVMFYTCFFGFLFYLAYTLLKRSWLRTSLLALLGALVLLVGVSRIYLGEHWASDVLGGYLLGSLALIAVIRIYHWNNKVGRGRFPT